MDNPAEPYILVVEDDADAREALSEYLIDAGYLPMGVGDGVEALSHLRAGNRPAMIVLDLILPRIDGWRFLSIIAQSDEHATIPVVVCSGADTSTHPPGVARDHVLPKPLDPERLMEFVTRYCGPSDAWQAFRNMGRPSARTRRTRPSSTSGQKRK